MPTSTWSPSSAEHTGHTGGRSSSGDATLDGAPYTPRNQRDAEAQGVALVFQELNVNRSLGIAENVMLGHLRDYRRFGLIDWKRLHADAQKILDRIGADFRATDDIHKLDLGRIKTIEVARALATNPRFVFFDESTAFLNHGGMGFAIIEISGEMIHVEADNLLYGSMSSLLPILRAGYKYSMAATPLNSNKSFITASVLWISSLLSLQKFR